MHNLIVLLRLKLEQMAEAIYPYETHMPSVDEQGKPCVKEYTGKLYLVGPWYIVIAREE